MNNAAVKYVIVERTMMGRYVALRNLSFATREAAEAHIVAKYKEKFRARFSVESRKVQVDRSTLTMTCQCCGGAFLANTGKMAHHGYKRPGYGWQTASCMGARFVPFEVDRAQLGKMIDAMRAHLKGMKAHRAAIAGETQPISFDHKTPFIGPVGPSYEHGSFRMTDNGWGRKVWPTVDQTFEVTRESFAAFKEGPGRSSTYGQDYEAYKAAHVAGLDREIKNMVDHIALEAKRFNGWKQTHRWVNKEWVKL